MNRNETPTADNASADDVAVALAVMATGQQYVQHADTKVSILIALQAGAVVGLTATRAAAGSHPATISTVLFGVLLAASLVAGTHLLWALRPRLTGDDVPSRFGIVRIPEHPPAGAAAQRDEAWAMARILAALAETKYRHIGRAMPWLALGLVAGTAGAILA
ncbi:hypothetical protein BJF79_43470 [Actinomadura sp. CNU-125]|uniref:hypothetical protein n=1 Tax=Actinomadura sp. CNU-125 TaxID=1904961 RepID=UPI000968E56A|nr:hypothetical protein [Actinomadura sp. CNU-125]OLT26519.1 hypothetical protein BJF79_43470 [Actinomadura sp. CNU-125]